MDDFLNGREVVERPATRNRESEANPTLPSIEHSTPAPPTSGTLQAHDEKGAHGTRVETVVERGRVTRLIVTCACGNVTEIECRY